MTIWKINTSPIHQDDPMSGMADLFDVAMAGAYHLHGLFSADDQESQSARLYHDLTLAPHHQYPAFYLWLNFRVSRPVWEVHRLPKP